ncbi:MAG: ester cyclase [Acetobacteraceae bacterium]|nr:ester cyclase [Acetobacteraceae bacterium]
MPPNTAHYADVPEFIYGITREIWEDRGIGGKLDRYYAPNILLRAPTGFTASNAGVTDQTLQTLHQFPDRQLVGEDVIWEDGGDGSFLSSHRLVSVMRHTGAGSYGPASGRTVRSRVIADCWVVDTVVTEEWLVRDQAAFARCLGMEPRALARQMADDDLRRGQPIGFFTPAHDKPSRYRASIDDDPAAARYVEGYRRLWDRKETAEVAALYFHGATLFAPGGDVLSGHGDIDRFFLGYLAAFPDARLTVASAIVNRDPGRPVRVALRWSLDGTHNGFGHFGPPTGAPVHVMGISHAYFVDGRIAFEWLLTDEVAIHKQIIAHTESRAGG